MSVTRDSPLGPVFTFEWVISSRRWQAYALRSIFVSALLAALIVVSVGRARGGIVPALRGLAQLGEVLFHAVVGTQLALVLLAAPAATAGSICIDRARGTLAHLLVSDLSDSEIVLGKLAVRLVPVLTVVASAVPVLTLLTLLGGVDPDALLGAFLVTLGMAVLGSSLALVFSLWAGKTHEAVLATYAVWSLWLLGPWAVAGLAGTFGVSVWVPPAPTDPFRLAFAPYLAPGSVGWAEYLEFLGVTSAASGALVVLAVLRLRAVCTRDQVRRRSLPRQCPWRTARWLRGLASHLPAPSLDVNPVLWREWHRNRPSRWSRLVAAVYAVAAVACVAAAVVSRPGLSMIPPVLNAFLVSLGLLMLSVTAATAMAEERVRGSLDVLMVTPLSTRQIVLGKWLGSFRRVPVLAVAPALVTFAGGGRSGWVFIASLLMPTYVVAAGAAVTAVGVGLATWCPRLGRAVGLTVAAYVIMTVGWMFLVMAMTGPKPYGFAAIAASPFYGPIVITRLSEPGPHAVETVAVVLWIAAYVAVAAALLTATLATFDRCLGRVTGGRPRPEGRNPRPVELTPVGRARGEEFVRH